MPAPPPKPDLTRVLELTCDDAFFAISGTRRLDVENLRSFAARRIPTLTAVARGAAPQTLDDWDAWVLSRCSAIATVAPMWWLPMADAVESGLSLEHGARGLRSLFTSKPSEKDVDRVKKLGALCVRAMTAVLASVGPLNAENRLRREALLASLGLADDARAELAREPPIEAEQLDISGNSDSKMARSI